MLCRSAVFNWRIFVAPIIDYMCVERNWYSSVACAGVRECESGGRGVCVCVCNMRFVGRLRNDRPTDAGPAISQLHVLN